MDTSDHFVLFADILGFKDLVKDHKVPFPESLELRERRISTLGSLMNFGNPLGDAFKAFHQGIQYIVDDRGWARPTNLMVFSDSLFLASTSWQDCFGFAESLMVYCIGQDVPMRMGIGCGSFVPYGYAFQEEPRLKRFSSQFFGTGVIYAVEAEKHLKGLRIAVHISAIEAMDTKSLNPYKLIPLAEDQKNHEIMHEWNYLGEFNDYRTHYTGEKPDRSAYKTLLMHIERMHERSLKPSSSPQADAIAKLYADTKAAFDTMSGLVERHDTARGSNPRE
jgi:hypothetical protein